MRFRGPYEYDKFTLNILNYVNYVNDYIADMENFSYDINDITINNVEIEKLTLKDLSILIDNAFNKAMENSEMIYENFIMNKEGD
jgi:uncharacterized protein YdcH (DUF465 family)